MRKLFLGAVALAAIAIPTAAHAEGSGDVHIGYRSVDDLDIEGVQYGGAAHVGFSNGWNLQFDAQNSRFDDLGPGSITTTQGAAHAFYRTEGWSAGGFISYGDALFDAAYGLGAEGALYLDRFTVSGSLEHITFDNDLFIAEDSALLANLGGAFFITDNLEVHAGLHYLDADSVDSIMDYSIGGEWRFDNSPFSVFADYRQHDEDAFDTNSWQIGARWSFGDSSLLDRDRSGASQHRGSGLLQMLPIVGP